MSLFDMRSYRQTLYPLWKQRKLLRGNEPEVDCEPKDRTWQWLLAPVFVLFFVIFFRGCEQMAHAQELTASWYSVESLKQEGTWAYSHGRMANGHIFSDSGYTCATRLFPLGSTLRVNVDMSKNYVICKVTDRIGKRFAKTRIDLSKKSFEAIARLDQGLIKVNVEKI